MNQTFYQFATCGINKKLSRQLRSRMEWAYCSWRLLSGCDSLITTIGQWCSVPQQVSSSFSLGLYSPPFNLPLCIFLFPSGSHLLQQTNQTTHEHTRKKRNTGENKKVRILDILWYYVSSNHLVEEDSPCYSLSGPKTWKKLQPGKSTKIKILDLILLFLLNHSIT
jgi:hypothetical protein